MATLVDTSVWIDFLRGTSNDEVELLEALLEEGEAHLCEIVYAEICFGARGETQFQKYSKYFSDLPFLALPSGWHQEAARMGHLLAAKGHRSFIADLLISLTALHHKVVLLTRDKDFAPYHGIFGLMVEGSGL